MFQFYTQINLSIFAICTVSVLTTTLPTPLQPNNEASTMPWILISMPAIYLMEQDASFSIQIYANLYRGHVSNLW